MKFIIGFIKYLLVVFVAILLIVFYYIFNGYSTLVTQKDIDSNYYVIDGWMLDEDIESGFLIVKNRGFKKLYSLGLINGYNKRYRSSSHAKFAKDRILNRFGFLYDSKIELVEFKANIDRTYSGVKELKSILLKDRVKSITLITIDVHTAKSLYIYEQVFKDSEIDVGILKIDRVNRDSWYKNSDDFVKVVSELIALFIAKVRY